MASSYQQPPSSSRSTLSPGAGTTAGLPQFGAAPAVPASAVPTGTLAPGTVVQVGAYTVTVERFLSEGGFAHVYLATSSTPIPAGSPNATTKHVLKRIAVPDKAGVEEVGKEVEVMKLLKSHPRIVNMIEASVSELPGRGYEIYILMEWCAGGGIIDMMNTRLQNRLTESEILKIFSDTVEAVAHMHYQSPPLIHRDLKVENILLSPPQTYKLCDFGSTTTPLKRVPMAVNEIQALEAEINKTTTLQYRAPELVDVWGRKGYDEKIDIWALGVLLYKLCYYTTPFEEHGPLAILNAQYKIPPYPAYSNNIKSLIGAMLQERASVRPNIYQVHEQVCRLRGSSLKFENKYAVTPTRTGNASPKQPSSAYGSILSAAAPSPASGPSLADTISPMRRGRPSKAASPAVVSPPPVQDTRMVRTGVVSAMGSGGWDTSFSPSGTPAPGGLGGKKEMFSDLVQPGGGGSRGGSPATGGEAWKMGSGAGTFPTTGAFAPSSSFAPLSTGTKAFVPTSAFGTSFASATASSSPSTSNSFGNSFVPSASSPFTASFGNSFVPTSSPKPTPAQLTGEAGPPLPRRPPTKSSFPPTVSPAPSFQPSKPELVSRSSQTSPNLLGKQRWNAPVAAVQSALSHSTFPDPRAPSPQSTKAVPIDLLGDDDDFAPPPAARPTPSPATLSSAAPSTFSAPNARPSFIGGTSEFGFEASREKFRPVKPDPFSPAPKPKPPSTDPMDRFPSLESLDVGLEPRANSRMEESWQPIVEKEEESSDEEFAPRKVVAKEPGTTRLNGPRPLPSSSTSATVPPPSAPKFVPTPTPPTFVASPEQDARDRANLPPIQRVDSDSEGEIDLGPALASIQRFAPPAPPAASQPSPIPADSEDWDAPPPQPRVPPTILAPKPQSVKRQAAISSLVSRYETISTEPGRASADGSKRPPPPAAKPKPASLRRDSAGVSQPPSSRGPVSHWTARKASADDFALRFPDSQGLESHLSTPPPPPLSTPPRAPAFAQGKDRQPFKPVPPAPGTPGASARPLPKPPVAQSRPAPAPTTTAEEEEKFAGVSNMRSRWEGMGKGGGAGSGPGKPAVRKEWGVV